jgi:hypothetical protein
MLSWRYFTAVGMCAFLSGCGGGGSGVASVGSSPPPKPANTSITNLVASQSFANDAASSTSVFDLVAGTVLNSHGAKSTLTINYDAGSDSYTIQTAGRSQTFAPSDKTTSAVAGEATFKKADGANTDYLTLVTTPFETQTSNKYVGLGFWQRNQTSNSQQNTDFDIFTYGLDTPATALPRTGTAAYNIDAFGLVTAKGMAPSTLQGLGTFGVDFGSGLFSADAYLTQYDLVNGGSLEGGSIHLLAGGHLASGSNAFAGNMSFEDTFGLMAGTINGHFYGPNAQEVGATFAGDDATGDTVVGGFTGQQGGTVATNLSLTNIVTSQLFYSFGAQLEAVAGTGGAIAGANSYQMIGQLTAHPDGSFDFSPGLSNLTYATFTPADKVSDGLPNFTTYQKAVGDQTLRVATYNPGAGNSELALTYASFGIWQQSDTNAPIANSEQVYFAYGITTPYGALTRRTGTGHYEGVAYGGAVDASLAARYALSGTSVFDVDFGAQDYTGSLALHGRQEGSGTARDFGSFSFAGNVGANGSTAPVSQNGNQVGNLVSNFFGPDGEEIAGTFTMVTGNSDKPTTISGVTAAKRR